MKNAILSLAATAGIALLSAAPSSAATCGNVTYTLVQTGGTVTYATCGSGGPAGNDTPSNVNGGSPGGFSDWVLADKSDGGGDQALTFGSPVPASGQTKWSISNPSNYTQILMTLKQGNSFTTWLLDATAGLVGTWGTAGPGASTNDLSHASIYYRGTPAPVPVPAAGLLLVGALGGLAALRRRKHDA